MFLRNYLVEILRMNELFLAMILILASVIIGTYLFYKGSVRFIFNLIRKKKDGYLNINEVLIAVIHYVSHEIKCLMLTDYYDCICTCDWLIVFKLYFLLLCRKVSTVYCSWGFRYYRYRRC